MVNIIFIDYLELVEVLNCLSWKILWFCFHGSLDDIKAQQQCQQKDFYRDLKSKLDRSSTQVVFVET